MKKEMKKLFNIKYGIIIFLLLMILISIKPVLSLPNGANIEFINSSAFQYGAGSGNISAYAGNISEININGASNTQAWQGYYGNVSGGLFLADSSSRIFYNWTAVATTGEIYSSINNSVIWTNIQCFNYTATGEFNDDSLQRGNTSFYGMNSTQINSAYGVSEGDSDSIENTFISKDHRKFYTNGLEFDTNECQSVKILYSTGSGVFEEVLLYSPDNRQPVFASIIQHETLGFDSGYHDFEMLVLEDGHGADVTRTPYYFYLEIGAG